MAKYADQWKGISWFWPQEADVLTKARAQIVAQNQNTKPWRPQEKPTRCDQAIPFELAWCLDYE